MRILFTGYTTLQIAPERRGIIQKLDVPAEVVNCLREMGHEVDWRLVRLGEELRGKYDLLWLNVASPASINSSRGALGALWTVNSGLPMIGFLDDWQYRQNLNAHKLIVKNPEARLFAKMGDKPLHGSEDFEVIKRYQDVMVQACAAMLGPVWDRGAVPVAPLYSWGDESIVQEKVTRDTHLSHVYGIDPSFITKPHLEEAWYRLCRGGWPPRERRWQLGAISKQDAWIEKARLDAKWAVSQFGHSKAGLRLPTETDVICQYARAWGVLSPAYPQNGSGWFRSRFIYAAFIGSVLSTEKKEADQLGPSYRYPRVWVENMSDLQLASLAQDQRDALWPRLGNRELFKQRLDWLVSHAAATDPGGNDDRGSL